MPKYYAYVCGKMNQSYTLTDWDPVAFPTPLEFYYYQIQTYQHYEQPIIINIFSSLNKKENI